MAIAACLARTAAIVLLLCQAVTSARQSGSSSGQASDVTQAIADGIARQVEPYPLLMSVDSKNVVGLVYTPYVRVARSAC